MTRLVHAPTAVGIENHYQVTFLRKTRMNFSVDLGLRSSAILSSRKSPKKAAAILTRLSTSRGQRMDSSGTILNTGVNVCACKIEPQKRIFIVSAHRLTAITLLTLAYKLHCSSKGSRRPISEMRTRTQ